MRISRKRRPKQDTSLKFRFNEQIRVPVVRVIDFSGAHIGELTVPEATARAHADGYDLVEINPKANKVLAIAAIQEPLTAVYARQFMDEAKKRGIEVVRRDVSSADELKTALHEVPKGMVDAMIEIPSLMMTNQIHQLIKKAKADSLPFIAHSDQWAEEGALITYGPHFRSVLVQTARVLAKVLRGGKPSEIPVEIPDKFVLVVNLKTAREIGVKIPRTVLERADRVVE